MITSKLYKIFPLINNSFEDTLNILTWYVSRNYNIKTTTSHKLLSPDKTTIGNRYDMSNTRKPEYISVRVNFYTNHSWTNSGGIEFCEMKTTDKITISIRWETINNDKYSSLNYTELDNRFYRKIKLIKLKQLT